jgi:SAM-dependent methyltransferase
MESPKEIRQAKNDMSEAQRKVAREIAQKHLSAGDPLGWFEELYSRGDTSIIPWVDLMPNPHFVAWLDKHQVSAQGKRILKVGCGLGDDAEELSLRGFDTTAFDISMAAIEWCHRRFPESKVNYFAADLFEPPSHWIGKFGFVLESYTLQVLPPNLRAEAMARIATFIAPHGTLLVIARGREPTDPEGKMPWPLTRKELDGFMENGLKEISFEDYVDEEDPPVRRFKVTYELK